MKKLLTAVFASLFLFAASGPAQAVPAYYTFDGTIEYTYEISAGLLGGLAVGDSLSYTFMIDFDVQGFITRWNGSIYSFSDGLLGSGTSSYYSDYFYADYIGGSVLTVDGGYYENLGDYYASERNYGYEQNYTDPSRSDSIFVAGEDEDDNLYLGRNGLIADGFVVGATDWFLYDQAVNANNQQANINSGNMVLVSISDTNPYTQQVPEPSTLLLLGSGLIGLGFFRRKSALRQAQNRL